MLQTLKLYSQTLFMQVVQILGLQQKSVFTLRHSGKQSLEPVYKDLDYSKVSNAVLITEVDDNGDEMPIAVAYVKNNHDIVLVYLSQLGELEK